MPGFTEGDGVGEGEGFGIGADDEGADDGIADGVSTEELRFFLLSEETPKAYPNAPPQIKTTTNPASSHLLLLHVTACFRAMPPGSCPYRRSDGFSTTIE